jgi:tRNA U34 5-carboxymethylaminomethyl modifying GTPase MnmE/TrmE
MTPDDTMRQIDTELSHVWMVRAFLKHSDEAAEDEELAEVHRTLYDYMLALGGAWKQQDTAEYLKLARKKYSKLRRAAEAFATMQPEISTHTNFQMAVTSLRAAVDQIGQLLAQTNAEGDSVVEEEDWSE